jgi:subtilisin family serine protease
MSGLLYNVVRFSGIISPRQRTLPKVLLIVCCCFFIAPASFGVLPAPRYAPGRILIKPRSEIVSDQLKQFHASQGSVVLRKFTPTGIQLIGVPDRESVQVMIERYQNSGLVEFAEPDYFVYASGKIPNDPFFTDGKLWGLHNTGQTGGSPGADIHAIEGWNLQASASNVVVAILDTGIRFTHEDLVSNLWVNTNDNTHGFNGFTGTNNPADDQGHGTAIAGIIGATGNNGIGITGVAWEVRMMACKCLDDFGIGTESSVIACLEFAQTNGARIINASFNGPNFSDAVSNSIASLRDSGIIVVAASGDRMTFGANLDITPWYPACYDLDNIVSVGASGDDDLLWYRSNFGATNVDLIAPGLFLVSTCMDADDAYCPTNFPDADGELAGTSFAAAHVSGALALILEKFPGEDYQTSIRRLLLAVDQIPGLEGTCVTGGRLNLAHAFNPPIRLKLVTGDENSLSLRVETSPNRTCFVEVSPDLLNWSAVETNITSSLGCFDFTDSQVANTPQLFYRAVALE